MLPRRRIFWGWSESFEVGKPVTWIPDADVIVDVIAEFEEETEEDDDDDDDMDDMDDDDIGISLRCDVDDVIPDVIDDVIVDPNDIEEVAEADDDDDGGGGIPSVDDVITPLTVFFTAPF